MSKSQDLRLIVMTRIPVAGKTKTRLIPGLGAEGAARLHQELIDYTRTVVDQFAAECGCQVEVHYAGGNAPEAATSWPSGAQFCPQEGSGLGERLKQALQSGAPAAHTLFLGTDCVQLTPEILRAASRALVDHDLVIGPAEDGGYYLIGMREQYPELFEEIDWGTDQVLQQTLLKASQLKLKFHRLPILSDIDTPADLIACRQQPDLFLRDQQQSGLLSIIIPARNEAQILTTTLSQFRDRSNLEVIVVDGGSTDRSIVIARENGAICFEQSGGRGRQCNAGAAVSQGEYLLFLHADCRLPDDFQQIVQSVLSRERAAGAFRLRVQDPSWKLRWVEWGTNWRSRIFQTPYGDQALFLRACDFFDLGGFRAMPIMEDYEFIRRLARRVRIHLADNAVETSARRWQKKGVWRTTLINQGMLLGYHLGVPLNRLAAWYRS